MKASEFITEAVTNPYPYDYNNYVQYKTDRKRKQKGITGRFTTATGAKYLVKGIHNGQTKAERDEDAAYIAAIKKRRAAGEPDEINLAGAQDERYGGIWEIHFDKIEQDEELDPFGNELQYKSELTKSGDEFRVFATVLEIIKRTIGEFKPEYISIKSANAEGKRASLYKRLADRFAGQVGYALTSNI